METIDKIQGRLHAEYWRDMSKFNKILLDNNIFMISCVSDICKFNQNGIISKIDFNNFKFLENNVILISNNSYNPISRMNLELIKNRISYFEKLGNDHYQYSGNKDGYNLAITHGYELCCYCIDHFISKAICLPKISRDDISKLHRFLAFCYFKYDSDEIDKNEINTTTIKIETHKDICFLIEWLKFTHKKYTIYIDTDINEIKENNFISLSFNSCVNGIETYELTASIPYKIIKDIEKINFIRLL